MTPFGKRKSKVFLAEGFAFVLYKEELCQWGIAEEEELGDEVFKTNMPGGTVSAGKGKGIVFIGSTGQNLLSDKREAAAGRVSSGSDGAGCRVPDRVQAYG